jgi:hypothetical protein
MRSADNLTALMFCLEIWEPQPPGTLSTCVQTCNGIALPISLFMRRLLSRYKRSTCTPRGVPFIVSPRMAGLSLRNPTKVVCALCAVGYRQSAGEFWDCRK